MTELKMNQGLTELKVNQGLDAPRFSQSREVALLFDATAKLLQTSNPLKLIDQLYGQLAELLSIELYVHFAMSQDRSHLTLAACAGLTSEQRENLARLEFNQAVCGTVAYKREAMVVNHVQATEDPLTEVIRSLGITAYVCHPLLLGEQLLGTLSFGSRTREKWHPGEVDLVRAISNLVAIAIMRNQNEIERGLADERRKQVQQALRESEEQYRTLFDSMREGFCIIERTLDQRTGSVDFLCLAANPAFAIQAGLGDVVGKSIRQLVSQGADRWIRVYEEVLKTGQAVRFEHELQAARRTLELYAFRIEDRTNRKVGVIFLDISERKQEQERLIAGEERLELALSAGRSGAWDWDIARGETTVTPSYRKLMGFPPDLSVSYDVWLNAVHPDDRERVRAYGEEFFRSGTDWRLDFRIIHPEHGERWIEAVGRLHRDSAGEPKRFVGVQFDVTERKRTEQALRRADREKDEFLAILGHELRNPLAPLSMSAELLSRARAKPELLDSIQPMMKRQLDQLTRLVDDLLDLSRLSRGRSDLQYASLDLRSAVDSAVEQCQPLIKSRGHRLKVQLPGEPVPVWGDLQRLTQVVSNLLSNSTKYSNEGGSIELRCGREGSEAFISVKDRGFGIPEERLDSLFDMFAQVPEHRRLVGGGGLGIGLAISRQLVELHGGSIVAKSEGAGFGSEFIVRLPIAAASDAIENRGARHPEKSLPRRVLVVDDNVDAADSTAMLLESQGHEIKTVYRGETAIEAAATFRPDVVLLDLGLPGIDGFEVARRIRAASGGNGIKIVALTGWGQEEDKRRTREAGFDGHLTKPLDAERLSGLFGA